MRKAADDALHNPASLCEIVKVTKQTIDNQQCNLKNVVEGLIRQLNTKDLRGEIKEESQNKKNTKKTRSHLEMFECYIEKGEWRKEYINNKVIWIYKKNELYQIHNVDDYKDFSERWTQVYPDKSGSKKHSVDLMYSNTLIKRFEFVCCDGGRISVAMPKMETDSEKNNWKNKGDENVTFFWEKNSLDVKLTKLIGSFYSYENIEAIAKMSKIEIR